MITPGQRLPLDLRLTVVRLGVAREEPLGALLPRRTLISVYMKNRTASCDRQNLSLRDAAAEFDQLGFGIVAVSRDTAGSHRRFAQANGIPYPLVSDPQDRFAQAADSLVSKSMYGRTFVGPARIALAVDPTGLVLAVVEKVDTADHAAQLRRLVRSL